MRNTFLVYFFFCIRVSYDGCSSVIRYCNHVHVYKYNEQSVVNVMVLCFVSLMYFAFHPILLKVPWSELHFPITICITKDNSEEGTLNVCGVVIENSRNHL